MNARPDIRTLLITLTFVNLSGCIWLSKPEDTSDVDEAAGPASSHGSGDDTGTPTADSEGDGSDDTGGTAGGDTTSGDSSGTADTGASHEDTGAPGSQAGEDSAQLDTGAAHADSGAVDDSGTAGVDVDGDGFIDGTEDKLVADGGTLCWHKDMIGWTGAVYIVGYGFGGDSDWSDTSHEATDVGDFFCYTFTSDSVYRVNAWSGEEGGAYTDWAFLDGYCGTYDDPLCYERWDGTSACMVVSDGVISPASATLCDGT